MIVQFRKSMVKTFNFFLPEKKKWQPPKMPDKLVEPEKEWNELIEPEEEK